MLNLPESTQFDKRLPKQSFYEHMEITPSLKRIFIDEIKNIYWRNKIAASTMNITHGDLVTEIEIFEIQLSKPSFKEEVLRQIDKAIPYHILYILTCNNKQQAWIGYQNKHYYHTEWMDHLSLELTGITTDAIYENYVRQIASSTLDRKTTLQESVEISEKKKKLQKQIKSLQSKVRKETQFNRQVELNSQLKKLMKELEQL